MAKEEDKNIKFTFVRQDPLRLVDELKESVEHLANDYEKVQEELRESRKEIEWLREVKSMAYVNAEIMRLKAENEKLKEQIDRGFFMTSKEKTLSLVWRNSWIEKNWHNHKYMGTIDEGFTYQFYPTSIGTIITVIAPDGEQFEVRNDLK